MEDAAWLAVKPLYDAVGFTPLPKQKPFLHSQHEKNILVGGVGAGKSLTSAQYAWPRVLSKPLPGSERTPRYWLVGENFEIPRVEFDFIYETLISYGIPIPVYNTPKDGRWEMKSPGLFRLETKSWTNPESLHSRPVQGMIICEAGLLTPFVWYERLLPRLSRVTGAWAFLSGTLEDAGGFFKDLVRDVVVEGNRDDWFGLSMATWENTIRFPGGLEDPEIQKLRDTTPPDIFMERYGAIPKSLAALVYREFSHTYHVGDHKFDRNRPVWLWTDPGGGYAANAAQIHGQDVYIIDEIHIEPGTTERVIEEAIKRPWWKKVEYVVRDATQTEAGAIWAGGHIWAALGAEARPVRSQKVPIEPGIEKVRTVLHSGLYDREDTAPEDIWEFQGRKGVARLHVDARCKHTIGEFSEGYKRTKLRSGEYSDRDVVKRNDHHMDAIRYGIADLLGFAAPSRPAARKVQVRYIDSRPN